MGPAAAMGSVWTRHDFRQGFEVTESHVSMSGNK
jgi:hypothetical protein